MQPKQKMGLLLLVRRTFHWELLRGTVGAASPGKAGGIGGRMAAGWHVMAAHIRVVGFPPISRRIPGDFPDDFQGSGGQEQVCRRASQRNGGGGGPGELGEAENPRGLDGDKRKSESKASAHVKIHSYVS